MLVEGIKQQFYEKKFGLLVSSEFVSVVMTITLSKTLKFHNSSEKLNVKDWKQCKPKYTSRHYMKLGGTKTYHVHQ